MELEFAAAVNQGRRSYNDDRALVNRQILESGVLSGCTPLPAVAAVCDGCGGVAGGAVAAVTVLEVLNETSPAALADADKLALVLDEAKNAVFRRQTALPEYSQMCTTVAGCVFHENGTLLFHSGDTRIYRYDGCYFNQMTVDHSAVQQMLDMNSITEEMARKDSARSIIVRCIGINCLPPEIQVSRFPIALGDTYLICSDGLWDVLPEERIQEILDHNSNLTDAAQLLIAAALSAGSDDNTTVCLCRRSKNND